MCPGCECSSHFLPIWTDWQCSMQMCPACECILAFPAKLNWLRVLYENVYSVWVCPGISCQTELADSALSENVSRMWVHSGISCQTELADSALSENVSSGWVCLGIFCQTGLPDSAFWKCLQNVSGFWHFLAVTATLWKCVQAVSVSWHFLPNWTGWQCSMQMCPVCECVLAFSANWTGWQCSLKMCADCECFLAFPAKLDWLTVLSENVSRMWVCPGISCQSGLAYSTLWKCVQAVSVSWHFLSIWTGWYCSFENVSSMWVWPGISWLAYSALWKCN